MANRWRREHFDPDGRFFAQRSFSWSMPDGTAREFAIGDAFPVAEYGCSKRQLEVLHRGRYLRCEVKGQREGGFIRDRGDGSFQVIVPGKIPKRVRGQKEAERTLATMAGLPTGKGF